MRVAKEALHHGIVITVAHATHADLNVILLEQCQKVMAGVLTALIAVMNEFASKVTPANSHA